MESNRNFIDSFGYARAKALFEAWQPNLKAVVNAKTNYDEEKQLKLAIVLENTQRLIDKINESGTQPVDVGPFKKHAIDIITAGFPNFLAEDIVSVQPLQQKIGQIFFVKYLYASNKGAIKKGDNMFSPYNIGPQGYDASMYSSEFVDSMLVGASGKTTYEGNLDWVPLRPGKVAFKCGATTFADNGAGVISGTGLSSGTIDYATGAYALTFAQATGDDVTVSYEYDLEQAPSSIPEVKISIEEQILTARARKLKILYAFDAAYDLQMSQGINMDDALNEAVINELKHETDGEIMKNLLAQAGNSTSWDITPPDPTVSYLEHKPTFIDHLIQASSVVYEATRRVRPNYIIVGKKAGDIIESYPSTVFEPAGNINDIQAGPYFAGTLMKRWKVYRNPYYGENDYLLGYKGNLFLDAGYVWAPYLPFATTQTIMMEDFVGRKGFAQSAGQRMLNSKLYVKGSITQST